MDLVGYGATQTVTRPNDAAPYLSGDVIGPTGGGTAAIEFKPMGAPGHETFIGSLRLLISDTALISGEGAYRLHLYDVTPPSALADNAPWDLPAGDRASYRGYIDIFTPTDLGSSLSSQLDGIGKQIKLPATSLFAYLVTMAAYTPSALRAYRISLRSSLMPIGASYPAAYNQYGNPKVDIVDSTGTELTYNANGRAAAASSAPVVSSIEDQRDIRPNANYRLLSALGTVNLALISANGRAVHKLMGRVVKAASVFIKIYDKATIPTNADTPVATIECVASSTFELDLKGLTLSAGLGIAMTGAAADNDATALTAGDVTCLNLSYAT